MDWFKKHADTALILGSVAGAMIWMNGKFTDVDNKIFASQLAIHKEISELKTELKTEIAVMKTVLIMQNVMPKELAIKEEK